MKKTLSLLLFSLASYPLLNGQILQIHGKPVVEIFTDFHYNIDDTAKTTGFAVNRAHIGYNFLPEGNFSSLIIVNIGNPEDLSEGSVPKRYAYFREASIAYKKDKLTINFGMVSTRIFDFQQKFWGKRYLGPEFEATYGYGSVADLGIVVDYKINDLVKADLSLLNGEGYTNIQVDNSIKYAAGLSITTPDHLSVRIYGDVMNTGGIWQTTLIGFAGLKTDLFSFGAEAAYKTNLDLIKGHNVWGVSSTASIFISGKSEIFGRFDYAASVLAPDGLMQWDYGKDNTNFIGGFEHTFSENLKIALNYRRTNPYEAGKQSFNAFYVNALFRL